MKRQRIPLDDRLACVRHGHQLLPAVEPGAVRVTSNGRNPLPPSWLSRVTFTPGMSAACCPVTQYESGSTPLRPAVGACLQSQRLDIGPRQRVVLACPPQGLELAGQHTPAHRRRANAEDVAGSRIGHRVDRTHGGHSTLATSVADSCLRTRSKALARVREGNAGRLLNPARSICSRTSTLRISHFPNPRRRRYAEPVDN